MAGVQPRSLPSQLIINLHGSGSGFTGPHSLSLCRRQLRPCYGGPRSAEATEVSLTYPVSHETRVVTTRMGISGFDKLLFCYGG